MGDFAVASRGDRISASDWNRVTTGIQKLEGIIGVNGISVKMSGNSLVIGFNRTGTANRFNVRVVRILNKSETDLQAFQPVMRYHEASEEASDLTLKEVMGQSVLACCPTIDGVFRPPFYVTAESIKANSTGLAFCGGIVPALVKVYKPALDYWYDQYDEEKYMFELRADPFWHASTVEKTLFGSDCGFRVHYVTQIAADGDTSIALIDMDDFQAGEIYENGAGQAIPPGGIAVANSATKLIRPTTGSNVGASFINSIYHELPNGYKRQLRASGGVVLTDQASTSGITAGETTFGLTEDSFEAELDGSGLIVIREAFTLPETTEVCCAVRPFNPGGADYTFLQIEGTDVSGLTFSIDDSRGVSGSSSFNIDTAYKNLAVPVSAAEFYHNPGIDGDPNWYGSIIDVAIQSLAYFPTAADGYVGSLGMSLLFKDADANVYVVPSGISKSSLLSFFPEGLTLSSSGGNLFKFSSGPSSIVDFVSVAMRVSITYQVYSGTKTLVTKGEFRMSSRAPIGTVSRYLMRRM